MVKLEALLARQFTRRKVVGLLSAGAGLFSIAKVGAGLRKASLTAGTASAARVTFPKRAIIRTVLQDMSPALLASGPVLFHEHLSLRLAGLEEHFTDDVDLMIGEVKSAASEGISCIVDAGHADMGRNMDALKRIATESKLPIVTSGGYYMQRTTN